VGGGGAVQVVSYPESKEEIANVRGKCLY